MGIDATDDPLGTIDEFIQFRIRPDIQVLEPCKELLQVLPLKT
jgi:hypothetical protein